MRLKAKSGVSGICLLGVEHVNDDAGEISVPDDVAEVALANGYEVAPAPEPVEAKTTEA